MKKLLVLIFLLSASTVSAQDFCQGDFNYDGAVAADDVAIFLEHFGRNVYTGNPCPADGPAPMARTGQTISHYPGDDGYYGKGIQEPEQRFTDNGDGTVTDNLTGLMWIKALTVPPFNPRSWTDALDFIVTFNSPFANYNAGYYDWRMPNVRELQSILDYSQKEPALPAGNPFELDPLAPLAPSIFWSATSRMGVEPSPFVDAYVVNLGDGTVAGYEKTANQFYVWPVRGGH